MEVKAHRLTTRRVFDRAACGTNRTRSVGKKALVILSAFPYYL
jgi:hypothetical protein